MDSAYINLLIGETTLHIGQGDQGVHPVRPRRLEALVRMANWPQRNLVAPDGEEFQILSASFSEADQYNETAAAEGAIGYLHHDRCRASIALVPAVFENFLALLKGGAVHMTLKINGLSHDDGDRIIWNGEELPYVPVVDAAFQAVISLPSHAEPWNPTTRVGSLLSFLRGV